MMSNNEKFQTFLKIIIWAAPIMIGVCLIFGAYQERISTIDTRLNAAEIKAAANELSVAILTRDIIYIKETVDRIDKKMDIQNQIDGK